MLRSKHLVLCTALLAAAGCTGHGVATNPKAAGKAPVAAAKAPATVTPAGLIALPKGGSHQLIAISTAGNLAGTVQLDNLNVPYLSNSAAPYHLNAAAPLGSSLVNICSLEEDLYTSSGTVVTGATATNGGFTLTGQVPGDRPFLVEARLAGDHRLSAIVPQGGTSVTVNEATSMVAELARWQLLPFADVNNLDLTDVAAADIAQLHADTNAMLPLATIPVTAGTTPSVEALKTGAGHLLRNLYVELFSTRATAAGASTPPEANSLSDKWKAILGYRPLALTRVAGNGIRGYNQGEGKVAVDAELIAPNDAIQDSLGNTYLCEQESYLIRMVPAVTTNGPYLQSAGEVSGPNTGKLVAGSMYTIAGQLNGARSQGDYNAYYDAQVVAQAGQPTITPATGLALYAPTRMHLIEGTPGKPDILFSSPFGARLWMIDQTAGAHYGVAMTPGKIYPIAGTGTSWVGGDPANDGAIATGATLGFPQAIAADASRNLFVLDSGANSAAALRVIRHSDGFIFSIPLTMSGSGLPLNNCGDIKLNPAGTLLYICDTERNCVYSIPAPSPAAIANVAFTSPAPQDVTRVLGNPGRAGFLDLTITGLLYPDIHTVNAGVAESVGPNIQVLLNTPTSLEFTPTGDLLVADASRIRLLSGGQVYTIGGGVDSGFLGGDSRLAYYLNTSAMRYSAAEKNVILTDKGLNIVRRLWTRRGLL
ncbi:MAG: repeat containing protein [Cyanobacteria bacterium RYN_339]|nr:repeat containing protein [Cyanobacteria bacterium RYN_339]